MNKPPATIDTAAINRIQEFNFPGKIRELENMIERAIVVGNGKRITLKDLPLGKTFVSSTAESLGDFEKAFILQILNKYDWNISCTVLMNGCYSKGLKRRSSTNLAIHLV